MKAKMILVSLAAVLSITLAATPLPAPLGRHPVSIQNFELKTNREDPFAPKPEKRRLMLSIYQPLVDETDCVKPSLIKYMPDKLAAFYDNDLEIFGLHNGTNGSLEQVRLHNCNSDSTSSRPTTEVPLLLFSTGLGFSRLLYSEIVSSVASSGYTIISIDHTYDADAVEFPGGDLVIGNQDPDSYPSLRAEIKHLKKLIAVREADVKSVLDALEQGKIDGVPCYGTDMKVGVFGHSLGGATAAAAMVNESRLIGGLNYDGSIVGPVLKEGLDKPFLLFGEQFHEYHRHEDPTWNELWSVLTGWKAELAVTGAVHDCFSDLPIIDKVLGIRKELSKKKYEKSLGTIDGTRMLTIIWTYTVAYFDYVMKGKSSRILHRNTNAFPEVILVRKSE